MASSAFKAYLMLIPKLDPSAKGTVKSELNSIDANGSGEKLGLGFGKSMLKAFAAVGVATAIANIIKQSVESYAEYEQLVGGVETLFKGSSDTIKQYAMDAYKTAGLSANQYMEQATSFSASLIQSLGGDTVKAAEYANLAITDMSDNANKMGTDIARIQDAYQGFAKQNYTMLDNLKLGYGGTKTEMERLIADANALREAQGLTADLTIDSYADIVEAIHTVQTEMGITGTTALEAADTIEGSVNTMKAAWTNFLTALAAGDVEVAAQNLVQSVANVIKNLIPVIVEIAEQLIIMLPDIIMMLIPVLLEAIWNLGNAVFDALGQILSQVLISVAVGTYNILSSIGLFLSELWTSLVSTVTSIWNDVSSAFSSGVDSAIQFVSSMPERILSLFSSAGSWLIDSGRSIIEGLVNGIKGAIDWAADTVSDALGAIRNLFPFSPAKEGPFSGKGWTLYSGMAIAESLGEGFDKQIDGTIAKVNRSMGALHSAVAIDAGAAGSSTSNFNITMNIQADSTTTLESLIRQAERAGVAYGRR